MSNLFDLPFLQVVVSLIFIYALLSVLVSLLNDVLARYYGRRGDFLRKSLQNLLFDGNNINFTPLLYNHAAIARLIQVSESKFYFLKSFNKTRMPSGLAPGQFAEAFIDVVLQIGKRETPIEVQRTEQGITMKQEELKEQGFSSLFKISLDALQEGKLKDLLVNFHLKANEDQGNYRKVLTELIGQWYDGYMLKVTADYKSDLRWPLFFMGLIVALALNVDSIHLARRLYYEPNLRKQLSERADQYADVLRSQSDSVRKTLEGQLRSVELLNQHQDSLIKKTPNGVTVDSSQLALLKKNGDFLKKSIDSLLAMSSIPADQQQAASKALSDELTRLPIGYNALEAPCSWKGDHEEHCHEKSDCCRGNKNQEEKMGGSIHEETEAERYYRERNAGGSWYIFLWIVGLIITAFSLSLGAPFWYDLLIKATGFKKISSGK